jgi:predicted ThiF/HesA family dinucleotide-utilizing enzyme
LGKPKVPDRLFRFLKEDVVVIDISGGHETRAQAELTFQNNQRPCAELDATVITRFG